MSTIAANSHLPFSENYKILIDKFEEVIEETFPLDLRIAKIEKVNDHPKADKLYVLDIDAGKKRQIVAGIKENYKKEELEGKNIIIVANLKPAKLRSVVSQGMLLAAEHGDEVKILSAEGKPGDEVKFNNLKNNKEQITYEQFSKLKIKVKGKKVICSNKILNVNKKEVKVDIKDNAKIC